MIILCHACHQPFEISQTGAYHCGHCGVVNVFGEIRHASEWEKTWKTRPLHGFMETAKHVIGSPIHFFSSYAVSESWLPPLAFGMIPIVVSYPVLFFYQTLWSLLPAALLGTLGKQDLAQIMTTPFVFFILATPILGAVTIAFSTALNHFFLWILKGNQSGLKGTFEVVCYSQAVQLFMIIPLVGAIVAWVWQMVLLVVGFKEIHRISYRKSALTVLIPLILCGGLVLFGIGILAAVLIPMFMKNV